MEFYTYTTARDAFKRGGRDAAPDEFYRVCFADVSQRRDDMLRSQLIVERAWEEARRPYYNVWPSIVPMLTRLNLDLDSTLIRLPLPAICVRLPCQRNPLAFDWQGQPTQIRSVLLGEAREGRYNPRRKIHKSREHPMKTNLAEKLNPARFSEMSPLMAAIVGFILDESFTKPTIAELAVSELEDLVYIRPEAAVGFEGIQSLDDLRNNWNRLMDAAQLTADERAEAVGLFNAKVTKIPETEV